MLEDVVCVCGHRLIYKSDRDNIHRFSTKVLKSIGDGSEVFAVCKSCNREVSLPISIHFAKSAPPSDSESNGSRRSRFRVYEVEKS